MLFEGSAIFFIFPPEYEVYMYMRLYMINSFFSLPNNLFCMDNVSRIYILINWMGLKGSRGLYAFQSSQEQF